MQHCNNKNHIRSQPPKQMKSSGVEAAINGEDRKVNNAYNTNPMLVTCHNATDIFISKSTKDTIWNMEYTVLSLPIRHNKQIDSIDIWTYAFINNDNVVIDRHPLLAGYLLSYMYIIRGAVVDAPFYRKTISTSNCIQSNQNMVSN
jgi:hypothetical protein